MRGGSGRDKVPERHFARIYFSTEDSRKGGAHGSVGEEFV